MAAETEFVTWIPECDKMITAAGKVNLAMFHRLYSLLQEPLAPLPSDLLAAYRHATVMIAGAEIIQAIAALEDPVNPERIFLGIRTVKSIATGLHEAYKSLEPVHAELARSRQHGQARFGEIVEATAHLAAIRFAEAVLLTILQAVNPPLWYRYPAEPAGHMEAGIFADHFDAVRTEIRKLRFPDSKELFVAVQEEADHALRARHLRDALLANPPHSVVSGALAPKAIALPPDMDSGGNKNHGLDDFVTLDQAAALIRLSKKTLERYLNDPKYQHAGMPQPDIEGGGGKANQWRWSRLRPWMEATFKRDDLPARFPSLHRP